MISTSIYGLAPRKFLYTNVSLFIIPLLFLILSWYNLSIQGPFYSFYNIDPSYAYLFHGFELLHFHAPGHVDHPGTTTQIFMAAVIFIQWLFTAGSCWFLQQPIPSLDHLFFTQPDTFLYAGAMSLTLINSLLFAFVSCKLWGHAKNLAVILAFQLGLFLFFPVVQTFSMFTPEPMLLTGVLLLNLALLPILFNAELKNEPKYAHYFGWALGFGMATKVTFLPLALFLFFYPAALRKNLLKFAVVSFLICTFPIWGRYLNMLKWLFKIAFHQGHYGSGAIGLVDNAKIIDNLKLIINQAPFFLLTLGGGSAYLLFTYKKNSALYNKFFVFSLGAMLFSLLLNLKHPGIRYMMPVLLLCASVFSVIAYQLLQQKKLYIVGLFVMLSSGLALSGLHYQQWHQEKNIENKGRLAFQDYVTAHQCKVIGFYNPSLQSYAMFFGNQWAWKKRVAVLNQYYPNSVFFEPERERFYDFHGPNHHQLNTNQVEKELKQHSCVVFQGYQLNLPKNSSYQLRLTENSLDNNKSFSAKFYELNTG